MRIAFITYEFPPDTGKGGIGTYTYQVSSMLEKAGCDVHVFAGSHSREGTTIENGIHIHRVKCTGPDDFKYNVLASFAREQQTLPFDVMESPEIHGNATEIKKTFPALPLVVRLHAPNWLVEHTKKKYVSLPAKLRFVVGALRRGKVDFGYWRKYDYKSDSDYLFVRKADYISAPSAQMKAWAVNNWNLNANKIRVVENAFVENAELKTARTENKESVILFYGRLNVLKGLVTATRAMKQILIVNPSWQWIVVGDDGPAPDGKGSMKAWMKHELSTVMRQVEFQTSVSYENIHHVLKRSSIVIVPSLFESYSYVTLEAMYAGKAVVGSRGTGIESLIQNETNGLLANPYSAKEWVHCLTRLIKDNSLQKRLGKEAIAFAENKQMMNSKIIMFYKNLLSKPSFQPCD